MSWLPVIEEVRDFAVFLKRATLIQYPPRWRIVRDKDDHNTWWLVVESVRRNPDTRELWTVRYRSPRPILSTSYRYAHEQARAELAKLAEHHGISLDKLAEGAWLPE